MTSRWAWRALLLAAAALAAAGQDDVGEILQLADAHVDPLYRLGGSIKTGCHRVPKVRMGPAAPPMVGGALGVQGGRCDTPPSLWRGALAFARAWAAAAPPGNASVVLWTGDSVRADNDPTHALDRDEAARVIANVTREVREAVGGGVRVLPAVGAADVYPPGELGAGPCDQLKRLAAAWKGMLPGRTAADTFAVGGYYAAEAGGRLTVAVLNTVYFSAANTLAGDCDRDDAPGRVQLMWLRKLIGDAKARGRRVLVAGHMPPSSDSYRPACLAMYRDVVGTLRGSVAGHLFGGLHTDEFSFLTADGSPPRHLDDILGVATAAPSLAPHHNAALRVYRYTPSAARLDSFTQYYADVQANTSAPSFQKEYSTVEAYRMPDLGAASWWDLASRMLKDSGLARLYLQFQRVSSHSDEYKAPSAPPRPPTHLVPASTSARASQSAIHSSVYSAADSARAAEKRVEKENGGGSRVEGDEGEERGGEEEEEEDEEEGGEDNEEKSGSGSGSASSSGSSGSGAAAAHVAFRDGLRHYIEWSD